MSIGVPIKVLHEAEGHTITLETMNGEVYRGKLVEAEDNMNCQLTQITMTARDGRISNLQQIFIRGSKIRFIILPDMLKNAPMFKRIQGKERGTGGLLQEEDLCLEVEEEDSLQEDRTKDDAKKNIAYHLKLLTI
eukprot:gene13991-15449_t